MAATDDASGAGALRWRGGRGHLEVWYLTATDPARGTGLWVHVELVAPTGGHRAAAPLPPGVSQGSPTPLGAPATLGGWVAVFEPDRPARWEPLGGIPVAGPEELTGDTGVWVARGPVRVGPRSLRAGDDATGCDLRLRPDPDAGDRPLHPFGAGVWRRGILPAAQCVPAPRLEVSGTVTVGGRTVSVDGARGALAHIAGHGNAHRWGWVHADLPDGGTCEVVAAVARRPVLNRLPPMAAVRLRLPGRPDWPAVPLAAAATSRTRLGPDGFTTTVTTPTGRLRVEARLPGPGRRVTVGYRDPDGAPAVCTNSEVADARISLVRRRRGRPEPVGRWDLSGTAHVEVGVRP